MDLLYTAEPTLKILRNSHEKTKSKRRTESVSSSISHLLPLREKQLVVMAKRKSKRVVAKKRTNPLDKVFRCLFCGHANSVTVKINRQERIGKLNCRSCNQTFQTPVNGLSDNVDVYSDWIDACQEVNKRVDRDGRGASDDEGGVDADADEEDALEGHGTRPSSSRQRITLDDDAYEDE